MATLYDYYNTGDDVAADMFGVYWYAQTFTTSVPYPIKSIKLKLYRNVDTTGNIIVAIRMTDASGYPSGGNLCSGTYDISEITTDSDGDWYEITFTSAYNLNGSTTYAIVVNYPSGGITQQLKWHYDSTGSYTGGSTYRSTNSGVSWLVYQANADFMFECWGSGTATIVDQSEDQNLDPGDTLELFVTVTGEEPISYQWSRAYEGGGDIEGATESTYTKENVTGDDGGGYYCTVTNEYGTVKSSTIDINVYPGIIDQSENMEVYEGSGISLFVEGTAYPEPTYQWYEGGVEEEDKIEGATESTLEFVAREGTFYCKVTSEDVSEDFSSVQALGGYEDTPIIPVGGVDESDRFMTEIGNILYEPNEDSRKYKQFYTGYNSGPSTDEKVHYAYSEDGVNWTKSSFNPVISDRAEDPYVLKVGSIYYLFAEDKQGGATDIKRWHSSDCETWVDDGVVLENEGVDWESHDVSSPIVWMEESIWYMLYEGRKLNGSLIGKMGLATSEDGLNWTKYGSNPVFVGSGVNGDFDKNQVVPDDIVKIEDTYYLTYHGHDGVEWRCGIATSPDLINWTRIGTPIQFYGEDSTPIMVYWDGNRYIFHIDTDTEGTYRGWIITGWLYGEVWSDPITVTIAVISGLYVYNPFDLPLDLGRTD